jgi:molybdenum cofactor cytidylyltransferase
MKVIGIYLAAGSSKRMGQNKLLLNLNGQHLGSLALQTALKSKLDHVIVVLKPDDSLIWAGSLHEGKYAAKWTAVTSEESRKGMSYSLKCGLTEAIKMRADAVIVMLADQPCITVAMINFLINTFNDGGSQSFRGYKFNEHITPPFLFSQKFYPFLMKLDGDNGARGLVNGEYRQEGSFYLLKSVVSCFDVDTMEDFEFIKRYIKSKKDTASNS